jgi:hypothetical protein
MRTVSRQSVLFLDNNVTLMLVTVLLVVELLLPTRTLAALGDCVDDSNTCILASYSSTTLSSISPHNGFPTGTPNAVLRD